LSDRSSDQSLLIGARKFESNVGPSL
jgi:hypothetical protein